jgi:hypothetical protein
MIKMRINGFFSVFVPFFLVSMRAYCFADGGIGLIELQMYNETTGYLDTPAEMLITDSQGRRTGYSPDAPFEKGEQLNMFREIPDAMYGQEGIGESSDEDPYGSDDSGLSGSRRMRIQEAPEGRYLLLIIGRKPGKYSLGGRFEKTDGSYQSLESFYGFIVQGQTTTVNIDYNPTPGTPAPVITKTVTFDALRQDLIVAQQLKQLGEDKFVKSLVKTIDLAEKLSARCDKRRHNEDKGCEPAVAILKLFVKRLQKADQKCDSKKPQVCDEDKDWNDFSAAHRKDRDYDDFFRGWDRDDWHKWKSKSKRSVTDEALNIIKDDAGILIKSLGGEVKDDHDDKKDKSEKGK